MPFLLDLLADYAAMSALAADTLRLHRGGIAQFALTMGRPPRVGDFTDENMMRHVTRRLAAGRARATVAPEFCKLLALWRFAAKKRLVDEWPTVRPPRVPDRVAIAWTREELDKVFAVVHLAGPVGDVPGYLWWGALLSVLWFTGERIAATLRIEWAGVDLHGLSILIPAEDRKGQTGDRLYQIAQDTADLLAKLPRDRRPFAWPYHEATLWNRYGRLLTLAGLPNDRRSKFHRIRKSTASHYEAAGGNATEFLGHSSRKVTRVYLDPRICKPVSAVDLLFRPGA